MKTSIAFFKLVHSNNWRLDEFALFLLTDAPEAYNIIDAVNNVFHLVVIEKTFGHVPGFWQNFLLLFFWLAAATKHAVLTAATVRGKELLWRTFGLGILLRK